MKSGTKNALITLSVGLALNIALGVSKFTIGVLSSSASITSDALNNISDAAVSLVTIIATALAARTADHEHPFGHGRYEYIATFAVGAGILAVGTEVFINGVERIIEPVRVEFSAAVWGTLCAAIGVKLFMAIFYFVRAAKLGSGTLKAAAVDSISDVAVTSAVLGCAIIEKYCDIRVDGYASVAISAVILLCAFGILRRTISRLLGERPDPMLYEKVREIISASQCVLSVHDLVINDYGAANKIAEADAVFPAEMTFVRVHAVCDELEREIAEKTGVRICIHADPLITDDDRLSELRPRIDRALLPFGATAHDVCIDDCKCVVGLDVHIPQAKVKSEEVIAAVQAEVQAVLPYSVRVEIDYI